MLGALAAALTVLTAYAWLMRRRLRARQAFRNGSNPRNALPPPPTKGALEQAVNTDERDTVKLVHIGRGGALEDQL